jgi:uncharacterized protein (TIGR00369 family)
MNPRELLELGRQVLADQGFSTFVGANLAELTPGRAVLEVAMATHLQQQYGSAHGGVVSYLIDNAITFAAGSVLGRDVVTVEYKVNYLKPAIGICLVATATVVSVGRTLVVCRCDVEAHADDRRFVCAVGQGL